MTSIVRQLGVFGGSFDPIHRGHVAPVLEAQQALGLDRVLFLPTACPPHKLDHQLASPWRRFAMVELALLDHPTLFAHPHELTLDTPAYTIETLEALSSEYPGVELTLLLGTDSMRALPTWRRGTEIPSRARVAVLRRQGVDIETAVPGELRSAFDAGRILLLETTPNPHSSTAIRRGIGERSSDASGLLGRGLEPRVLDYIRKYELY